MIMILIHYKLTPEKQGGGRPARPRPRSAGLNGRLLLNTTVYTYNTTFIHIIYNTYYI